MAKISAPLVDSWSAVRASLPVHVPFLQHRQACWRQLFVGYVDSIELKDKHVVPKGNTTIARIGTLYALAHEVLLALLAEGIDVSSSGDAVGCRSECDIQTCVHVHIHTPPPRREPPP